MEDEEGNALPKEMICGGDRAHGPLNDRAQTPCLACENSEYQL